MVIPTIASLHMKSRNSTNVRLSYFFMLFNSSITVIILKIKHSSISKLVIFHSSLSRSSKSDLATSSEKYLLSTFFASYTNLIQCKLSNNNLFKCFEDRISFLWSKITGEVSKNGLIYMSINSYKYSLHNVPCPYLTCL